MSASLFPEVTEPLPPLLDTLQQARQQAVLELEQLVAVQTRALTAYADLWLGQLQAAARVQDPASLQDYCIYQSAAATALCRQLMQDSHALLALSKGFQNELDQVLQDSLTELDRPTDPVA